jgi:cytochrome c biogenesis protein CcdA
VIEAPLALAFASGMVAIVNPCGFAMLPAYLGFFLGVEAGDRTVRASVSRSLGVGLSVSAGFLLVFTAVGLAIYHLSASVDEWTPWATVVIGVVLVVVGVAMLAGFEPRVLLPKLERGGRSRDGSARSGSHRWPSFLPACSPRGKNANLPCRACSRRRAPSGCWTSHRFLSMRSR